MRSILFEQTSIEGVQLSNRFYAKALKEHVSIPVILFGGLRTSRVMEKLVEDRVTALVSMCRPFIREPQLIKRWKDGDLTKAKCISCNKCLENWIKRPTRCYIEEPLEESQSIDYTFHRDSSWSIRPHFEKKVLDKEMIT